jgi:two-component system sensor histidine kinase YesM
MIYNQSSNMITFPFEGSMPMFKQYRTFYSVLLLILLTTIVVMLMYAFTINTSIGTVKRDIQLNNLNRIRFVVNNLDHSVRQLDMLGVALETDSKVGLLSSVTLMDSYEQVKLILDLTDKMNLQSFSEGWNNRVSIYSPLLSKWIGSTPITQAPPDKIAEDKWILNSSLQTFLSHRSHAGYTIQIAFPQNNIQQILDQATIDNNTPFFYKSGSPILMNSQNDTDMINEIIGKLTPRLNNEEGSNVIDIGDKTYMVNYLRSEALGWYLIDFLPLNEALQPIVKTKNFFYVACISLFLAGVVLALFLYRKVQLPIVTLLKGVRLLKHGDFSYRIRRSSRNEFDVLYDNFNDMAAQIEDLIEKVYKEKIISREAMVKQLQAQINPHFLYNCLFFINNMTRLGNDEAVTAMTKNLADYFRYTTRLDEPMTTLEKEIGIVENYLNIQCLRMDRLSYEVKIPDSMMRLAVPKLLIQPLVENSVIHGIEKKQSARFVSATGVEEEDQYRLIIEDDGKGMMAEEIRDLVLRIKHPLDDSMGCALWNIQQRMNIHFSTSSGMEFDQGELGGLRVTLFWPKPKTQEV